MVSQHVAPLSSYSRYSSAMRRSTWRGGGEVTLTPTLTLTLTLTLSPTLNLALALTLALNPTLDPP